MRLNRLRSRTRTWRSGRKVAGELSLGASTTIAQYVLPRLLGAFIDEHPRVQFSLHSGSASEIVQLLFDDKVSVGLIEGPERARGIRTEPFMQDELVLITPPASESDHLSRDRLVASNLLVREHGYAFAQQRMIVNAEDGDAVRGGSLLLFAFGLLGFTRNRPSIESGKPLTRAR